MCYCDPSNPFTGKSCGKEKCRPWEYQEAMRELTAERDALQAELSMEQNRRELAEEEIEVLHSNLDGLGLPREISNTLSLWGRVTFLRDARDGMKRALEEAFLPCYQRVPDSWRVTAKQFCGTHTIDKEIAEHWMKTGEAYPLYASPVIDPRLNDDGEYYIRGKDINAILKGGENDKR